MSAANPAIIRTVRFSDGSTFQTTARTAGEYLFAQEFIRFYVICIVLYAAIISGGTELKVDPAAGMVFWASILMTSFAFLMAAIWINIMLVDRGVLKYIHTYAALVPVIVFNSAMVSYLMAQFDLSYGQHFGSLVTLTARNVIIVVCYDILHGRYVAPRHPLFVPQNAPKDVAPNLVPNRRASDLQTETEAVPIAATQDTTTTAEADANVEIFEVGKMSFCPSDILWVKSEDHYLKIQLTNRSQMVRGKLSAAVDKLDQSLGLQINRSVWVAFKAIEGVEGKAGHYVDIRLSDETTHRIANSRRLIFELNYDTFLAVRH